jgi:hypothetical protein
MAGADLAQAQVPDHRVDVQPERPLDELGGGVAVQLL